MLSFPRANGFVKFAKQAHFYEGKIWNTFKKLDKYKNKEKMKQNFKPIQTSEQTR